VHAHPAKALAREEAATLGRVLCAWVRENAERLALPEGSYATVLVGDHNLAACDGVEPEPRGAWGALVEAGFSPVPFEGGSGGPAYTNLHDLGKIAAKLSHAPAAGKKKGVERRTGAPKQFDHAFVARPPWLQGARARVVDITERRYGHAAPDFLRLRRAAEELTDTLRDPTFVELAKGLAAAVCERQAPTLQAFKRELSDHRPISVRLVCRVEGGGGGGGGGGGSPPEGEASAEATAAGGGVNKQLFK
jgi:hypothetical protein